MNIPKSYKEYLIECKNSKTIPMTRYHFNKLLKRLKELTAYAISLKLELWYATGDCLPIWVSNQTGDELTSSNNTEYIYAWLNGYECAKETL